ncbi:MAG: ABC transporter substrate-binding protein [Opitutales bacterium]
MPVALLATLTGCSGGGGDPATEAETAFGPVKTYEEALACVREQLPGERYVTNAYLPGVEPPPPIPETPDAIRVGAPWILNDETAAWYVGMEKGFFRKQGIEMELIPGNIDHVQSLAAGKVDIAIAATSTYPIRARASTTPVDLMIVATLLKTSPYTWMGIDESVPRDQPSSRRVTPQDMVGATVGIQVGYEFIARLLEGKHGLPAGSIEVMKAGPTPEPLLAGRVDYYAAWIVNQPRILEAQGYYNWTAFPLSEFGINDYADASVFRRETVEARPDLVRRYLLGLEKAIRFMLENPRESAEITARYAVDADLTPEQVMRRFELQRPLILTEDGLPLMGQDPARYDELAATLHQYGQLDITGCP